MRIIGIMLGLLLNGLAGQALPLPPDTHPPIAGDVLSDAIVDYRLGQYQQAYQALKGHPLPTDPQQRARWLYYQAISATRLGQYPEARDRYQQLLDQFANTPEAQLAQTGLSALDAISSPALDAPPGINPATGGTYTGMPASLSPQAMAEQQQFNQLMGMLDEGNNTSLSRQANPLATDQWLNSLMGASNGTGLPLNGNLSNPEAMSQLLMNQWLGQMDFSQPRDRD
jgi:tetratricopeptide (TPR) repeat protein